MSKGNLTYSIALKHYKRYLRKYKKLFSNPRSGVNNNAKLELLKKRIVRLFNFLAGTKQKSKLVVGSSAFMFALFFTKANAQTFAKAHQNPYFLKETGNTSSCPAVFDVDGDGDLDIMSGSFNGNFYYYQNIGSATAPHFIAPVTNPFNLTGIASACTGSSIGFSAPVFVDVDGDGNTDLLAGNYCGDFMYFKNNNTGIGNPSYASVQVNPFGLSNVGYFNHPTVADVDGDGDIDILSEEYYGDFKYYPRNPGNTFGPVQTNPFLLSNIGHACSPNLVDMDGDGDFDIVCGDAWTGSNLYYIQKTPAGYAAPVINPWGLTLCSGTPTPFVTNLDNDCDLDLITGAQDGSFVYFQDTICLIHASGSCTGTDLVSNGDFTSGNTGFQSDFTYFTPATFSASGGRRTIVPNSNAFNGWASRTDHTSGSGNLMIFDGFNITRRCWYNTYTVAPRTTYTFSVWVANIGSGASPPSFYLDVNGCPITVNTTTTSVGSWELVTGTWFSNIEVSANVAVYNLAGPWDGNGDDFAIDDISFNCALTLPIELLSFTGHIEGPNNLLQWSTASEVNNDYFTLERSIDGQNFEKVGTSDGAGSSNSRHDYSLLDEHPYSVTYYRLKQTDLNGNYTYSNIVVLVRDAGVDIINIFPNPTNGKVDYIVSSSEDTQVNVSVIDVLGREVMTQSALPVNKGVNTMSLDVSTLSKGSYYIQVRTVSGIYKVQKKLMTE